MNIIRTTASVNFTAGAADKQPTIRIDAYGGGPLKIGGKTYVVDTASLQFAPQIKLLIDHENKIGSIVGHGAGRVEAGRVLVDGILAAESPAAQHVIGLAKSGIHLEASIGIEFDSAKVRTIRAGDTTSVNDQSIKASAPISVIREGLLRETSLVPLGADNSTRVQIAAHRGSKMSDETPEVSVVEIDPVEAEQQRIQAIEALLQKYTDDPGMLKPDDRERIVATAIEKAWKPKDAEVKLLRASRPQARYSVQSRPDVTDTDFLTAAAALAAGVPEKYVAQDVTESAREQVMNQAVSAAKDMSISGIMRAVLMAAGRPLHFNKITSDVIRETFVAGQTNMLRANANFSTLSLPQLLSNVQNKGLLAAYAAVPTTWQFFCKRDSAKDFKEAKRIRLTAAGELRQLLKGGELQHIGLDEETYAFQLRTEGAIISIDRQDLINDDLGGLMEMPRFLGELAAKKLEEAVFVMLLSNPGSPAFFSNENGNLGEGIVAGVGTDSRLNVDGLSYADQIFAEQVDSNGKPTLVQPRILLAPPAIFQVARVLMNSSELTADTNDDVAAPRGNPFKDAFTPIRAPWLKGSGTGALTGGSDSAWYLLAGPDRVSAMTVAFLNDAGNPTVETAVADFGSLGLQTRVYHDFDAKMHDPRGGVKMTGAAAES